MTQLAEGTRHGAAFFAAEADRIARLCHAMAERFAAGGRLVAFGASPAARSDVRHVAVEFVHPVIVGKRALPALGLGPEGGPADAQAALVLEPGDIAMAFEGGEAAVRVARERGCLTIAWADVGAEWEFAPPSPDPFVRQEMVETLYHLLWELVHVFFEHRGLLSGQVHDPGASSFLYPFLGKPQEDLEAVMADVAESVRVKAREVDGLRARTLEEGEPALRAAAAVLRERFDRGGRLLVLGNGGSATDAMDVAADFRWPPRGWPSRPVLDLTEDAAILTALANDIGVEAIFSRQVIAHGRDCDVLLAISTSGGSANVLSALAEARRRGLATVALVGYDGGRIAGEGLADHVVVTRSQHIPRIQEAQASAYHVLRELVEAREGRPRDRPALGRGAPPGAHPGRGRRAGGRVPAVRAPARRRAGARRLRAQRRARRAGRGGGRAGARRALPRPPARGAAAAGRGRAGAGRGHPRARQRGLPHRRERAGRAPVGARVGRRGDLRGLPGRAVRPRRPPPPLPVRELHQLRAALHDRARRALRPAADDDGRVHHVPGVPRGVRRPRRPALPRAAQRVPRVRPGADPARRRRGRRRPAGRDRRGAAGRADRRRQGPRRPPPGLPRRRRGRGRAAARAQAPRGQAVRADGRVDVDAARALVELGAAEEELLRSRERPIVLAPRRAGAAVARRWRRTPASWA